MRDWRIVCFCLGFFIISAQAVTATERHRAVAPPVALPSSADLIDNALAAGTITPEQAVSYRVFAEFDDPRLPAQFHGDDSELTEGNSALDAGAQWSNLSPAAQDAIAPFFAPPFYVGSWWDLRRATASAVRSAAAPCVLWKTGGKCPVSGDWVYVAGAHVRVWYQVAHPEDQPIAADLVKETDNTIWDKVNTLLKRPPILENVVDGKTLLDVALTDSLKSKATTYGVQPATECKGKGAAYILLNRDVAQSEGTGYVRSIFAHELFHAGQLAFKVPDGKCFKDNAWLLESTATWFEDQTYHELNREQQYAKFYLGVPEKAIDDPAVARAQDRYYGEYLFFYYLTSIRHVAPADAVRPVFEAAENTDALHAFEAGMTAAGAPLDKSWPDFALYAWNKAEPYILHDANKDIKDVAKIATTRLITLPFDDVSYEFLPKQIKLPHLSIRYAEFDFPDATASSIVLYNGLQNALGNQLVDRVGTVITANPVTDPASIKGAHVDALQFKDGQWTHADLTGLPYKTLCRDAIAERIDKLIIILSNSSVDNELQVQGKYGPTLQATNIGCYAWEGKADLTYNEQDSVVDTMTIRDLRLDSIGDVPDDANTPLRRMFKVTKGTYSWAVTGASGGCGYSGLLALQDFTYPLDFIYTFPYANTSLALAGARGIMTDLGLTWSVPQNVVTQMCGQQVNKIPWKAAQFILLTTPDQQAVQIGSDGRSLSIDISKVGLSSKGMKGTWTLNAVRQ